MHWRFASKINVFWSDQAKLLLEKSKATVDAENVSLTAELQQQSTARQDAERKRKHAETQLQELTVRLTELERGKADVGDKAVKLQARASEHNSGLILISIKFL